MATLTDLENAIDALLGHPLGIGQYQLVRRVAEKAYEAYVFGLCLRAVREIAATCLYRHRRGNCRVWRGSAQTPKTDNAVREIDVPCSLAAFLKASVGARTSGFLFQTESGRPLTQRNVLRDGLGKIRRDMKLEAGKAFHSFRRFRAAHLRKNRVPWDLQKLWLGHANKDVTDRYAEQLKEDIDWRKQEAERAGLGFELPALESSVGLLGLPKQKNRS